MVGFPLSCFWGHSIGSIMFFCRYKRKHHSDISRAFSYHLTMSTWCLVFLCDILHTVCCCLCFVFFSVLNLLPLMDDLWFLLLPKARLFTRDIGYWIIWIQKSLIDLFLLSNSGIPWDAPPLPVTIATSMKKISSQPKPTQLSTDQTEWGETPIPIYTCNRDYSNVSYGNPYETTWDGIPLSKKTLSKRNVLYVWHVRILNNAKYCKKLNKT